MPDMSTEPHGRPGSVEELKRLAVGSPGAAVGSQGALSRYHVLCGVPGETGSGRRRLYSSTFGRYVDIETSKVRYEEEVPSGPSSVAGVRIWVDRDTTVKPKNVLVSDLLRGDLTLSSRLRLLAQETQKCYLSKSKSAWCNPWSRFLDA